MNTFGLRIRELRAAKNYSLRSLAPIVGVGFTYLSKIERGKLDFGDFPSANLIHRLAAALEADEEELLLLSHRIPESISKRIFEQPEAFRKLAQCDSSTIDRMVENLRLEKSVSQRARNPK
jgi:transcriptional regulator with XRE-family HTH domain